MPVELYGATVAGVVNFVPELHLDAADAAVIAQVTPLLELVAPVVTAKLGAALRALAAIGGDEPAAVYADVTTAAGRLVEQGAASYLQDLSYPELAATSETDQAWGAVLWQRFESMLADLAGSLLAELERLGVDEATGQPAYPAVASPPPYFTSTMKF